ncbi:MAG: gamma-glutamyl-gamma-aminobutyrate hydrolase family protein, partial [Pirellulales bacterium]|nr:gamma-glutamyl-gamma-aminobutyrate hydrolase family protein [Pirellulales bacterium]
MQTKPLIALNTDFRKNSKGTASFSFLADGYFDALASAGAIPIVLPPLASRDDLSRLLDLVDGVLLVGGADLNPNNDGFMM